MRRAYLITLFVLLGSVLALNGRVDLAGTGSDHVVTQLAAAQRSGGILVAETDFDQRLWVRTRLSDVCPRVLVLGSSTVGGLSSAMLKERSFLNAWLTGPTLADYEALFIVLSELGCVPRFVIMGVDPWLFNAAETNERWRSLSAEWRRYQSGEARLRDWLDEVGHEWAILKERLSFTTTLESVRWLLAHHRKGVDVVSGPHLIQSSIDEACGSARAELRVRYADGHFISCPRFIPSFAVREGIARDYVANDTHGIQSSISLDEAALDRLEALLKRYGAAGMRVLVVAPAVHPQAYKAMRNATAVANRLDQLDAALERVSTHSGNSYLVLRDPALGRLRGSRIQRRSSCRSRLSREGRFPATPRARWRSCD